MSEARDNFYSWVSQNQVDDVNSLMDYVSELEQEKERSDNIIYELNNENINLKQQKAELMLCIENLWRKNRPLSYSKADHLKNPLINSVSDSEKKLIKIFLKYREDKC